MSGKNLNPDRRSFLEALAGSLVGFFREFNRELYGPSEQKPPAAEQDAELTAVHARLDELEGLIRTVVAQGALERQQVFDTLSRLEQLTCQITAQVEILS